MRMTLISAVSVVSFVLAAGTGMESQSNAVGTEPLYANPRTAQTETPLVSLGARAESEAVNFQHDDGTVEECIGEFPSWSQYIFANRFPYSVGGPPFALTRVSMIHSYHNWPGESFEIVIALNPNGDLCFNDMEILRTQMETVQHSDGVTWDTYTLSPPVPCKGGDVYLGAVYRESDYFPCIDSDTQMGMAWMGSWFTSVAPVPVTMPPDASWFETGSVGFPGTWLIRGTGWTMDADIFLGEVGLDDACPYGFGDGDGVLDPGESFTLHIPLKNDGPLSAEGLTATITTTHGGIIWTSSTAWIGALNPGATYTVDFAGSLSKTAVCGTSIPFDLHVTGATFPTTWNLEFSKMVGTQTLAINVNLIVEDFETFPLAGWTITDISGGGAWAQGSELVCYSGGRSNGTGACGDFIAADADCPGIPTNVSTTLATPVFDLAGFSTAELEFNTYIADYYGTTRGYIDIYDGQSWSNLETYSGECCGWNGMAHGPQSYSLTAYAGKAACQLRFWYVAPLWEAWWQLDDVRVTGHIPAGSCFADACDPFQVWLAVPSNGGNIYGLTTLCAGVSQPSLPVVVNLFADGVLLGSTAAFPYCVTFDASALSAGAHTYTVEAITPEWGSFWGSPVTLYTVPDVAAHPEAHPPAGVAPLEVAFYSNAINGTGVYAYEWYFGESTGGSAPDSTSRNPAHVYSEAGDFLATLIVTDTSGVLFICDPIKIAVTQLAAGASHPVGVPLQHLAAEM